MSIRRKAAKEVERDAEKEGWLQYDDGEVYPTRTMLTKAGRAEAEKRAAAYLATQTSLFSPAVGGANVGTKRGVSIACDGGAKGECTLRWIASPPAVCAVRVEW